MFKEEDLIELNSRFYTNCKPLSRIFTLLTVPTLLFILVILCYFGVLPLKVEIHSVILIGAIYFIYLFFIRHNAYFVACKFRTLYADLQIALLDYINSNLLTIAQTSKANGSVDDFLQDYTSNLRNSNFSSIASGIFPTLGILGTFISIALSMPDFTSNNIAALDSEITKLLSGVGTAFYVSIYGIFLSIWWIFFEKFGLSRFHHDSYIIKESTKNFFWTKIDIESIHIKSNIDNFSSMSKIFAELTSSQAMYDINRSIEQRAKSIDELLQKEYMLSLRIDENIANFEKLASAVEKLSLQSNSQTMIFKDVSDNLNKNILELNSHMNNLSSENLKAIYTNIVKSIETMKSDMEKIEWKFEEGLKESLRQIDLQTANIVKDLTIFKDLSK
ncbi:MotA/TolQ/ExbB proton channel family protein [Arcobacter cryaerophilus gv. pseudocryaerophilus]|jgi:methyl-accepting chemotaxis protein|uniref:MotA/TolQ/ExbB proton channel family protein n=3 Tax=unclassified Arcobacter TaxID=2593671 RepID=A0AA96L619_9BACT|nr:MotA/TolQ/ExbB proton channel family protein [Aliarcobacter cryaerophilus]WNL27082.1 MotA/TolQ/ExbB proton channel family protein [Arcobacter sp. AZ-2023]WPD05766.1 MotA/TolQ/ExbB proton channel family protein [Arcobacter sp. DSM 115956]WPD07858.1 MotA/TolQ/ExbB proton channel family protein [Arcobacter sp. DSM 115955]MCT7432103.1 MotA/TolQ/ExbB proton channel family protein [Aliarcobacter cryaerophilus]MCT7463526.1 MotA/TolQ/ExbB proton channel family protein [Aliarcobacter cryaerophilus]